MRVWSLLMHNQSFYSYINLQIIQQLGKKFKGHVVTLINIFLYLKKKIHY